MFLGFHPPAHTGVGVCTCSVGDTLPGYLAPEPPVPCPLINCEFWRASALLGRCFMKMSVLHKQYLLQFIVVIGIFLPAGT